MVMSFSKQQKDVIRYCQNRAKDHQRGDYHIVKFPKNRDNYRSSLKGLIAKGLIYVRTVSWDFWENGGEPERIRVEDPDSRWGYKFIDNPIYQIIPGWNDNPKNIYNTFYEICFGDLLMEIDLAH